jgi:hypothetical protein
MAIFLLILGFYIAALLYLNAKVKPGATGPGETKIPGKLRPLRWTVSFIGLMFLAPFLLALLGIIYCLLTGCQDLFPR